MRQLRKWSSMVVVTALLSLALTTPIYWYRN